MKKEIDFSQGVRGKYAGQRLRLVGDAKARIQKPDEHRYLVNLSGGIEFEVFAANKPTARQAALDYFGRGRLPKGTKITLADKLPVEFAQVTAIGSETVVALPKSVVRKPKVQTGDALYFVETATGIELTSKSGMLEVLKKSA